MPRVFGMLLALAACGVESEEEALMADAPEREELLRTLPRQGGCGDATVFGTNATDTQALFIHFSGIAEDANRAGQPLSLTLNLPDPNVRVSYQTGRRLTSGTCVGAFPIPGPQVRQDFDAVGGTLRVRAVPTGTMGGMPTATLDVQLVNPSFASPAGVGFGFMGSIEIPGVGVGLYPP